MIVRVTQGKVKKSIFDVLSGMVEDKVAIDIFAGTGSIGMEALNRGARRVLFIDKNRKSASIIRNNLKALRLGRGQRGDVWVMDAFRAIPILKRKGFLFDIFFADPPYNYRETAEFLGCFFNSEILARDARGVVEHSRHLSLADYPVFKKWKEKRFGETVLTFYRGDQN